MAFLKRSNIEAGAGTLREIIIKEERKLLFEIEPFFG
jgi:hypothetical protein